MRTLLLFITIFTCVFCKNNVKSLTKSLGQEVIEIGPVRELPLGLEEEPSAENYQDEKTTTTIQPATKRESKITTSIQVTTTEKTEITNRPATQEDEEAKIEKELAEMYKDNADYKADSSEVAKEVTTTVDNPEDKPIGRQRNFQFQPDVNNRADIERFRTSVDEISCNKRVTKKLSREQPVVLSINNASSKLSCGIVIWIFTLCYMFTVSK